MQWAHNLFLVKSLQQSYVVDFSVFILEIRKWETRVVRRAEDIQQSSLDSNWTSAILEIT